MLLRVFYIWLGAFNILSYQVAAEDNQGQSHTDITLGKYPWIGRLASKGILLECSAILIGLSHALTVPYCVDDENTPTHIVFGDWSTDTIIDARDCNGQIECLNVPIESIATYPTYQAFGHSISIVKLNKNVQLSANVAPIHLPPSTEEDNEISKGSILGLSGFLLPDSKAPWKVNVKVLARQECLHHFLQNELTSKQLCGSIGRGLLFQSGSALMGMYGEPGDRQYYLVGILDFGVDSLKDKSQNNSTFTLILPYKDWILKNI